MDFLSQLRINKNSDSSIYVQVKNILRDLIVKQHLKPDYKIPSENELAAAFEISRMTVRHAIRELIDAGYLYVKRGEGTFVRRAEKTQKLIKLEGFSREMMQLGYQPSSKVLIVETLSKADEKREAFLGLEKREDDFLVRIKRLLFLDDKPYAIESSFIDYSIGKGLLDMAFEGEFSIYRYIEDECKITLAKAKHTIEPALADKDVAELLEIAVGDPVLLIKGISYTKDNNPIEYLDGIYRGSKYKLNIEIKK